MTLTFDPMSSHSPASRLVSLDFAGVMLSGETVISSKVTTEATDLLKISDKTNQGTEVQWNVSTKKPSKTTVRVLVYVVGDQGTRETVEILQPIEIALRE